MNSTLRAGVAEAVATFTLTFIGAGAIIHNQAAGGGLVAIALAHGLALSMAVFATGHISGGHVNPAVTAAMLVTGRIKANDAVVYLISQVAGAVIAALCLKGLFPAGDVESAKLGATLGKPEIMEALGPGKILIIEAFLTFLLVTTIFGVAVDPRGPKNVYGFAIGLTVGFDILAAGAITGASMNPARSFGPALIGGHWDIHWVYWAGPILGGCAAALLYQQVLLPSAEKSAQAK
jgi:MIP family channel proteins